MFCTLNAKDRSDLRLCSEVLVLLKFEGYRCTDNSFISVLVANGTKQMNELHLNYN